MRARCLPNVDHGEVVADCWETRAARCLAFHADGPGLVVMGVENLVFSFSDASRPCCPEGGESLDPRPNERKPERVRARGGLSAPGGVVFLSNDPSNAGRSSIIRLSTKRGSDRDGESAGGSGGRFGGGEADSGS